MIKEIKMKGNYIPLKNEVLVVWFLNWYLTHQIIYNTILKKLDFLWQKSHMICWWGFATTICSIMITIGKMIKSHKTPSSYSHIQKGYYISIYSYLIIESRRWILTNYLSFHFSSMEIPVATTSSTQKRTICPFISTCHELSAPIHSIATNICRMILLALNIPHSSYHWRWCGRVFPSCAIFLHYYLPFLHPPKP